MAALLPHQSNPGQVLPSVKDLILQVHCRLQMKRRTETKEGKEEVVRSNHPNTPPPARAEQTASSVLLSTLELELVPKENERNLGPK